MPSCHNLVGDLQGASQGCSCAWIRSSKAEAGSSPGSSSSPYARCGHESGPDCFVELIHQKVQIANWERRIVSARARRSASSLSEESQRLDFDFEEPPSVIAIR